MGSYIPSSQQERMAMLEAIGLQSLDELYAVVPEGMMVEELKIPAGMSEWEVRKQVERMAGKNKIFSSIFRGAGAYHHYIPAAVKSIVGKEEFLTSYTPYQPEISQGLLQGIFEYQTLICELTGMDVANASVYDGATAAAEAIAMCRDRKKTKALVSGASHPMVIETITTYCKGAGVEMAIIPLKDGKVDEDALTAMVDEQTACVYLQQPNYYGVIEDAQRIGEITHQGKAKYIMGVNPFSAMVLSSPQECGADIAVGEGQPLGIPLAFGGPYLGFMATTSAMMRKLPGRIVGETVDHQGNRAFVLTLQAREQHIRREKASSNICSNQAHCALTAAVYMTVMGGEGMKEVAEQCYAKAHYLAEEMQKIDGLTLRYAGEFFHEFITETTVPAGQILSYLEEQDILGGYPVDGGLLWCATEMNSKEEMDQLIEALQEVIR